MRPKPVDDDPTLIPRQLWRDAEFRLNLMEHRSATALRMGAAMARIVVEVEPIAEESDLWTPGVGPSGVILGPDGRPLGSPSALVSASSPSPSS